MFRSLKYLLTSALTFLLSTYSVPPFLSRYKYDLNRGLNSMSNPLRLSTHAIWSSLLIKSALAYSFFNSRYLNTCCILDLASFYTNSSLWMMICLLWGAYLPSHAKSTRLPSTGNKVTSTALSDLVLLNAVAAFSNAGSNPIVIPFRLVVAYSVQMGVPNVNSIMIPFSNFFNSHPNSSCFYAWMKYLESVHR